MHRFRPESLPAKIDSSIPKEFTLKNTIVVWSRVTERHAGVEPTCCWFWIKKTKRGTPQIHRPRCYYITRKFFMQAEKSRSGASSFFPVENILIHTVFNAKGWNKRLILLYHAALFHANRKPPISARRPTAPCERISESTSTSTPKVRKQISQSLLLRNHHLFLIMEQELQGGMWARTHNNGLVLVTPSPGDAAEATLNMNNRISLSEPLR